MPIDIAALLEPLDDGGAGVGVDLRAGGPGSEVYLNLKDLRASARLAEREASQGEADSDPLHAGVRDWAALAETALELLAHNSKDLEVAAWLTEAWLRTGGIGGLANGFALLEGLIERYWSQGLWPAADEDGEETRLTPLFGLFGRGGTGTLLQPIKLVALSDRAGTPVTLWSAELAAAPAAQRNADEDIQARVDEKRAAALDAITGGIGRSSKSFLIQLRADLVRAAASLETLMQTIDSQSEVGRFGSQIGAPIAAAIGLLDDHAGAVFMQNAAEGDAVLELSADPDDAGIQHNGPRGGPRGPMTRDEALGQVLALADFFEQREPQAMVGPALRDVVRRARMPIDSLLAELLPDMAARTIFLQRAGIRLPPSDVESSY